jgi:BolA protein
MTDRITRIREALTKQLQPTHLNIEDDSHRHAGHAGAADGRGHFNVQIVAHAFEGKLPIARHRLVYAALGDMMTTDIHALSIDARTPEESEHA